MKCRKADNIQEISQNKQQSGVYLAPGMYKLPAFLRRRRRLIARLPSISETTEHSRCRRRKHRYCNEEERNGIVVELKHLVVGNSNTVIRKKLPYSRRMAPAGN